MDLPVATPALPRPSPVWRCALLLLAVSSIQWLGGAQIRAIIGYDLLKFGTLEFEEMMSPDAEREVFRLISFASVVVNVGYLGVLVSGTAVLAGGPFRLKQHGWVMMSAILFYAFVPVELYTMFLDGQMIHREFFTTADNSVFRELLIARIGALNGVPVIATLCYYTILLLAVFQPMTRSTTPGA
jgi:hypothetical protein